MRRRLPRIIALAAVLACLPSRASDWPQFLGPTRDGVYSGGDLAAHWPKEGPPVLWDKHIGQGFSGPVVASGRLVLFHRLEDKAVVECMDAKTGARVWQFDYPTDYRDDFGFDEGPRATPAIASGRVYACGAEGVLTCLDAANGKKVWSHALRSEFHAAKGFFGIACSPLVEGDAVLMIVGGSDGAGVVAFDRVTGKVLWKALDDEASYSSPTAANLAGKRSALFLTRSGLAAIDPATGNVRFQFPFRPPMRNSVTAATPLVIGDKIFLSASYGTGAALLSVTEKGADTVYAGDDILSCHYATSIYHEGCLFGIHGRTDPGLPLPGLRCVEMNTGKIQWQRESFGAATLTRAGDRLLILTEKGELIDAKASRAGFEITSRAQVLGTQVRAHPALANGLFYARSKDKLVCLDLRDTK